MALNYLKIMQEGSDGSFQEIAKILPAHLNNAFKETVAMGAGTDMDWNTGLRFTKTISAPDTFTFSNLHVGVKLLEITGDYAVTLPSGFVYAGGTRASSGATLIQVVCTVTSGSVAGWYVLLKNES
jgi:hypothetical protein